MTPLHPAEILVVDDIRENALLLTIMLQADGYTVRAATSGQEALRLISERAPDLVVLDVMMPEMDGYTVTRLLKKNRATQHIPIVLVTALSDHDSFLKGLEVGAEEFLTKPVEHVELRIRVRNLLRLKELHDQLNDHNQLLEHQVKLRTAQLEESYRESLYLLTRAAEYRDETTGGHINRISDYCRVLAQAAGESLDFQKRIFYASPMHDIGKIGIPDNILLKKAALTPEEWSVMKTHTTLGARMLDEGRSEYMRMGAEIALCHHERWDGSGYPAGLSGQKIPLPARMMALCDCYDALRSARPYKEAYTHERTMEILTMGDGRTMPEHFDPDLLEVFAGSGKLFAEIYRCLSGDNLQSAIVRRPGASE